jgi:uncharacterized membrane protein
LSNLWNADRGWSGLPEVRWLNRTRWKRGHVRSRWTHRQRSRRASLRDHHSGDCVSGAGAFQQERFIRFHSFQCIFFAIAWTVLWIGLSFIAHIPFLGWATVLLWPLFSLAGFVIWLILVLKAYQGQMFKLPVIGDMAEQQAGA